MSIRSQYSTLSFACVMEYRSLLKTIALEVKLSDMVLDSGFDIMDREGCVFSIVLVLSIVIL